MSQDISSDKKLSKVSLNLVDKPNNEQINCPAYTIANVSDNIVVENGQLKMTDDFCTLLDKFGDDVSRHYYSSEYYKPEIKSPDERWSSAHNDAYEVVRMSFEELWNQKVDITLLTSFLPDGNPIKLYTVGGDFEESKNTLAEVIQQYLYIKNALEIDDTELPNNNEMIFFDWLMAVPRFGTEDEFESEISAITRSDGYGTDKLVVILNKGKNVDDKIVIDQQKREEIIRHELTHWILRMSNIDNGQGRVAQIEGFTRMCENQFNLEYIISELKLQARSDYDSPLYQRWITSDYMTELFSKNNTHLEVADRYDASGAFYCYMYHKFNEGGLKKGAMAVKSFLALISGNLSSKYSKYEDYSAGDLLKTLSTVAKKCGVEDFNETVFLDDFVKVMEWPMSERTQY